MWQKFVKFLEKYNFNWEIGQPEGDEKVGKEQRWHVYNQAFNIDGFKEMLSSKIYTCKRKAVESKGLEVEWIYYAEAYQSLLNNMRKSHELIEKFYRDVEAKKNVKQPDVKYGV